MSAIHNKRYNMEPLAVCITIIQKLEQLLSPQVLTVHRGPLCRVAIHLKWLDLDADL